MKVFLKPRVLKQLRKIPISYRKLIEIRLEQLEKNPYPAGTKKLEAREGYRLRIGDYRVLYTLDSKLNEILILSVAHRREAYKY